MNLLYFLPVSALGININGFVLGPLLIVMFGMGFYQLICRLQSKNGRYSIDKTSFILIWLFIFFVFTNLGRNDVSSYILPLLVFFLLGLIAFESPKIWPHVNRDENIIKRSFWFLFYICMFEVFFSNLLPGIWNSIETSSFFSGSTNSYFGFRRIRAFTPEPSDLAKLLVLYHFLLRFYLPRIGVRSSEKEIYGNLMLVALTLSNTAILGIIMLEMAATLTRKKKSRSRFLILTFKNVRILAFAVLTIFVGFYFFEIVFKLFERFGLIIVSLNDNIVTASVGFRATAIIMPYIYLSEATGLNFWLGEGFSNFSEWLILNYSHMEFSGFYQGQPGNFFSAITLSGGVVGALLYAIFILYPFRRLDNISIIALVFFMFLNLTSGNLTSPFYWGLISIAYGASRVQRVKNT